MWKYRCTDEMYHAGIKGMKWGVRRFQNEDGSLTPAGKKRYADDSSPSTVSKMKEKSAARKAAKQEKAIAKLNETAEKYKLLGYNEAEAQKMAEGRAKTIKALKVIGAVTAVAVAGTLAYKAYQHNADKFISPDTMMQTVHKGLPEDRVNNKGYNPFYATYDKRDHKIYASKMFSHFDNLTQVTRFQTEDGIRVASPRSGKAAFKELLKTDASFKDYVENTAHIDTKSRSAYDFFNRRLVVRDEVSDAQHKKFYELLKSKGYGAVLDVNDSKLENWTFNPVIVFDNAKKNIVSSTVASQEQLGTEGIRTAKRLSMMKNLISDPGYPLAAASVAGYSYLAQLDLRYDGDKLSNSQIYLQSYKIQHPNTNLTDKEIVDMFVKETNYKKKRVKT